MANLGKTIAQLKALRLLADPARPGGSGRLAEMQGFGSNPGALRARIYMPDNLPRGAPLVVVLHGCTQTAAGYDQGCGWSDAADEYGFALLYPEQQRANNPNLCFNWFSADDARRDSGEALSIRQMTTAMTERHDIDPDRVFVTGLSAGGAMTSIMLAAYPELFAGGAIIAGLPYGNAYSVGDAFARMRGDGYPSDAQLASLARQASPHDGPWPTISVWHGTADRTVDRSNADRIVAQWRGVHGLEDAEPQHDIVDGVPHLVWLDTAGRRAVESYSIAGMGHGTPLQLKAPDACGKGGPYMLDVGISSTRHLVRTWGLGTSMARVARGPKPAPSEPLELPDYSPAKSALSQRADAPKNAASAIGTIIEDALRSAGLMR